MMIKRQTSFIPNFICIALILTIHCQKNSTGLSENKITIQVTNFSIIIKNHHDSPVHFLAVESKTALLIDWYPACEADSQNRIDPNKSTEIAFKDIHGYYEKCEIIIYWWLCIKKSGEDNYVYDMIRSESIQTK